MFAAKKCKDAIIHAFEPMPQSVTVLRRNLAINHIENVTVHALALSDQSGVFTMYGDPLLGPVWFSLFPRPGLSPSGQVQVVTGDELVEEGAAPNPNVLKIDAEGFEFEVLAGLRDTLQKVRNCVMMVENHDVICAERGVPPRREERLLKELGFELTGSIAEWHKSFWKKRV